MAVLGYKCFYQGLINEYGQTFSIGKIYIAEGTIRFGPHGNGFHLCKRMEDTFRYIDAFHREIDMCFVRGDGLIKEGYDDYNEYYEMYAVQKLEIIKKLTREEIITRGLKARNVERFIQGIRLQPQEIELFKAAFPQEDLIQRAIAYYQEGQMDAYQKRF